MNKKYYFFALLFIFIISPIICSADMVLPSPGQVSIAFLIDLISDAIVLTICYMLIRENMGKPIKFLLYILLVAVAGFLIDIIGLGLGEALLPFWGIFDLSAQIYTGIFIFILLFLFNYLFSKLFMKLTSGKAIFIGLVMGIITHPFLIVPFFWFLKSRYF